MISYYRWELAGQAVAEMASVRAYSNLWQRIS